MTDFHALKTSSEINSLQTKDEDMNLSHFIYIKNSLFRICRQNLILNKEIKFVKLGLDIIRLKHYRRILHRYLVPFLELLTK